MTSVIIISIALGAALGALTGGTVSTATSVVGNIALSGYGSMPSNAVTSWQIMASEEEKELCKE